VNELRRDAPGLVGLLADGHPARAVTRNLFRLSRLASRPAEEAVPRTEIDMVEQWWSTADGKHDDAHRERARLLRALAEQALMRPEPTEASNHPAAAVDDLLKSETLRDLGGDRVSFRHDVFREWAIANLLFSTSAMKSRSIKSNGPRSSRRWLGSSDSRRFDIRASSVRVASSSGQPEPASREFQNVAHNIVVVPPLL